MGSVLRVETGRDAVVGLADSQEDATLVTVVIPARDEEDFIGACLESVLAQGEAPLQVIVVDGGSRDATREVVGRYAQRDERVELLINDDGRIPTSLNVGLRAARGRWLVRVDAHSTIPPGYVATIARHLATGRWGGVGGRKDGVADTPAGRAIAAALASPFGVGNSTYHHGTQLQTVDHIPFGAYPTALLREIGGWDERLSANEDYELDFRLRSKGQRLLFDPGVAIAWRCRETTWDLFRQYRRYGRGKAVVARMHPRSVRLRHLAAPALVAGWAAALCIALFWPPILALVTLPYLLALCAAAVVTARRMGDLSAWPRIGVAFAAMHAGWGLGFWEGLAREVWVLSTGRGRR
jgi:succinoglycan biosynthesis protein ExoA